MSAGNHSIAVAWAASQLEISAKAVMQASANPARVAAARAHGAEVLLAADGLAGGAATAIKALSPKCRIFGVEPEGADTMPRSFAAGVPQRIERLDTIADSLAPPMTLPHPCTLCRANVDTLVKVSDDEIRSAMGLLLREMKLAVEPAGAAGTAALVHHLKDELRGARAGVIVCSSNIDIETFAAHVRLAR